MLDPVENDIHVSKTVLHNYTVSHLSCFQTAMLISQYNWPYTPPEVESKREDSSISSKQSTVTTQAVVFGLGSMFNHSTMHQNVGWDRDVKNLLVTYKTLRDIRAGEELCISYGLRLTFKDAEPVEEEERDPDDWTDVLNIIDLID